MRGPAAVLWDMDGTLVDSEKLWTVSLHDTARLARRRVVAGARGTRWSAPTWPARSCCSSTTSACRATPRGWRAPGGTCPTGRPSCSRAGLPWRPGAQEALRLVDGLGCPTALVTNTGRALTEAALDSIGREHFTVSVCADEVPRGKPDPDPYLRAAELLGVAPRRCLAVEDSPNGALAAERAGSAVLVVPCDVPVPAGPGRVLRLSLVGLTLDDLRACYAEAQGERVA